MLTTTMTATEGADLSFRFAGRFRPHFGVRSGGVYTSVQRNGNFVRIEQTDKKNRFSSIRENPILTRETVLKNE